MLFLLVGSCGVPPKKSKKTIIHDKYIIVVDLSDRIIKSKKQINRDKELINYIFNLFYNKVRNSLFIKSNDIFQVVIADQDGIKYNETDFEDILFLDLGQKENNRKQRKIIDSFKNNLNSNLNLLYKNAKFSLNHKDYKGADIWKYFNDDLNTDLIKDANFKNHIFILTDGYMFVKNKQSEIDKSFPHIDFDSLSSDYRVDVCVLEISPKENMNSEVSRLKIVWGNWFLSMGLKEMEFLKANNINQTKQKIEKFINRGLKSDEYIIKPLLEIKKDNRPTEIINNNVHANQTKKKDKSELKEPPNKEIFLSVEDFIRNQIDKSHRRKDKSYVEILKSFAGSLNAHFPDKNELSFSLCISNKDLILNELNRFNIKLSKEVQNKFDQF
jgi:hypothetical protein